MEENNKYYRYADKTEQIKRANKFLRNAYLWFIMATGMSEECLFRTGNGTCFSVPLMQRESGVAIKWYRD